MNKKSANDKDFIQAVPYRENLIAFDVRGGKEINKSVDEGLWDRLIDVENEPGKWFGATQRLWEDVYKLLDACELLQQHEKEKAVIIAIADVNRYKTDKLVHDSVITPINVQTSDWQFLGFDTADFYLSRCECPGARLENDISLARKNCKFCSKLYPGDAPYYLYAIYECKLQTAFALRANILGQK